MDDIRAQILGQKATDLQDGSNRSPLQDFWGTVEDITTKNDTFGERTRVSVVLKFSDLEVIKSSVPYQFPNAEIVLGHSERKGTYWAYFVESLNRAFGNDATVGEIIGKRVHMVWTPNHNMRAQVNGVWAEVQREAWEITEAKGVVASQGGSGATTATKTASAKATAVRLLDGKLSQEFTKDALRDQVIRTDSELMQSILNGQFIPSLEQLGVVTKDSEGRYHVDADVAAAF